MEYQTADFLRYHMPHWMQVMGNWIDAIPWQIAPWVMLFVSLIVALFLTKVIMWLLKAAFGYEEK